MINQSNHKYFAISFYIFSMWDKDSQHSHLKCNYIVAT